MTSHGWIEARNLQSGDRVHILNRKGGFGSEARSKKDVFWMVGLAMER